MAQVSISKSALEHLKLYSHKHKLKHYEALEEMIMYHCKGLKIVGSTKKQKDNE